MRLVKCEFCGVNFLTWPCKIRIGRKFCSRSCSDRYRTNSLENRFWNYVGKKQANGCILWDGMLDRKGYGKIRTGSAGSLLAGAHRISYQLMVGPIPDGLFVLHSCDNPTCINPTHLFLGTQFDNMSDMISKGRKAIGENHGISKLTNDKVIAIRKRYATDGISQHRLANEFNVSQSTVSHVITEKTWKGKHVN